MSANLGNIYLKALVCERTSVENGTKYVLCSRDRSVLLLKNTKNIIGGSEKNLL